MAPDLVKRKIYASELAMRAEKASMKAIVLKCHHGLLLYLHGL